MTLPYSRPRSCSRPGATATVRAPPPSRPPRDCGCEAVRGGRRRCPVGPGITAVPDSSRAPFLAPSFAAGSALINDAILIPADVSVLKLPVRCTAPCLVLGCVLVGQACLLWYIHRLLHRLLLLTRCFFSRRPLARLALRATAAGFGAPRCGEPGRPPCPFPPLALHRTPTTAGTRSRGCPRWITMSASARRARLAPLRTPIMTLDGCGPPRDTEPPGCLLYVSCLQARSASESPQPSTLATQRPPQVYVRGCAFWFVCAIQAVDEKEELYYSYGAGCAPPPSGPTLGRSDRWPQRRDVSSCPRARQCVHRNRARRKSAGAERPPCAVPPPPSLRQLLDYVGPAADAPGARGVAPRQGGAAVEPRALPARQRRCPRGHAAAGERGRGSGWRRHLRNWVGLELLSRLER